MPYRDVRPDDLQDAGDRGPIAPRVAPRLMVLGEGRRPRGSTSRCSACPPTVFGIWLLYAMSDAPTSSKPLTVLVQPGYASSGDDHWQTHWEAAYGYRRIEQSDWLMPQCDDWVSTIEKAARAASGPVALVAHSLGVIAVAHWAAQTKLLDRVVGALLVAPADVDSPFHTPDEVRNFSPLPLSPLGLKAVVVGSENDPFMELPRSEQLAIAWGARFVCMGKLGHINSESKLGLWPEGHLLLQELIASP